MGNPTDCAGYGRNSFVGRPPHCHASRSTCHAESYETGRVGCAGDRTGGGYVAKGFLGDGRNSLCHQFQWGFRVGSCRKSGDLHQPNAGRSGAADTENFRTLWPSDTDLLWRKIYAEKRSLKSETICPLQRPLLKISERHRLSWKAFKRYYRDIRKGVEKLNRPI